MPVLHHSDDAAFFSVSQSLRSSDLPLIPPKKITSHSSLVSSNVTLVPFEKVVVASAIDTVVPFTSGIL